MIVAAIVMLSKVYDDEPDRVDFIGHDCVGLEDALGHVRDACAHLPDDGWKMVTIVPGHTVAQVAEWHPTDTGPGA